MLKSILKKWYIWSKPNKISVMATENNTNGVEGTPSEPSSLEKIIDSLPAIIYINEVEYPGDIGSFHNLYLNRSGFDFIGCTREEFTSRDIHFFRKMIHPDDLGLLEISLQTVYPPGTKQSIAATMRIMSKDLDHYCLFHCIKTILETFDDGRLKKVFVFASEIKEITPSVIQVLPSLNENVKKNRMILQYHFTPREQQVLHLIVKGETDSEIADKLIISISTARKHRNNLILKSRVKNSAALVALAVEKGGYSALDKL